jgi:hypothetical protein
MRAYLTYIDILGFGDLVESGSSKIEEIYSIVSGLNAHTHNAFNVIVFSDTILVYSTFQCSTPEDHRYASMFSIEFTQDLFYRCIGRDIYFRAIIDYDEFHHERLERFDKYYGKALVRCHKIETGLQSIGTYITDSANRHQTIFRVSHHCDGLGFVHFQQSIGKFSKLASCINEYDFEMLHQEGITHFIVRDMLALKHIYQQSLHHSSHKIRVKYQTYFCYYERRFPFPVLEWKRSGFGMAHILPSPRWQNVYRSVLKEYSQQDVQPDAFGAADL